eukprot:Gregarina_sp_Poly_1__10775@NODE_826_length_6116_cov_38_033229_g598_i0_p3_GENE_NODE_826_length_6116_cov_38_033229_g598_i0NODE_826_length_6116_cov_38_033229_g598_i0_p3_ORF_typecomplete_len125_score3_67_NODE_826_length_6116_cov_38_033229_g598_i029013275
MDLMHFLSTAARQEKPREQESLFAEWPNSKPKCCASCFWSLRFFLNFGAQGPNTRNAMFAKNRKAISLVDKGRNRFHFGPFLIQLILHHIRRQSLLCVQQRDESRWSSSGSQFFLFSSLLLSIT